MFSAMEMERRKVVLAFKDLPDKVGRQPGGRHRDGCVPRMLREHRRAPDRHWGETGKNVGKDSLGFPPGAEAGQTGVSGGREQGRGDPPPPTALKKNEGLQAKPVFSGGSALGELIRGGVGREQQKLLPHFGNKEPSE